MKRNQDSADILQTFYSARYNARAVETRVDLCVGDVSQVRGGPPVRAESPLQDSLRISGDD